MSTGCSHFVVCINALFLFLAGKAIVYNSIYHPICYLSFQIEEYLSFHLPVDGCFECFQFLQINLLYALKKMAKSVMKGLGPWNDLTSKGGKATGDGV